MPLGYEYLGEKTVKNIPKPIRAYRVMIEPAKAAEKMKRWTVERIIKEKRAEEIQTGLQQSEKGTALVSDKKRLLTIILCAAFGIFGAHRFYVGKIRSGYFQLFTVGGIVVWFLVDFFIVLFGEFTDSEGRRITKWV